MVSVSTYRRHAKYRTAPAIQSFDAFLAQNPHHMPYVAENQAGTSQQPVPGMSASHATIMLTQCTHAAPNTENEPPHKRRRIEEDVFSGDSEHSATEPSDNREDIGSNEGMYTDQNEAGSEIERSDNEEDDFYVRVSNMMFATLYLDQVSESKYVDFSLVKLHPKSRI